MSAIPCPAAMVAWLSARGIRVRLHGGRLQAGPAASLTDDAHKLLTEHSGAIADYLRAGKPVLGIVAGEPAEHWADHPWPTACPKCGRHDRWEDARGGEHCTTCDPPTRARAILEAAQRIRRRLNLPANPRAERLLRIVRAECTQSEAAGGPQTHAEHATRPESRAEQATV